MINNTSLVKSPRFKRRAMVYPSPSNCNQFGIREKFSQGEELKNLVKIKIRVYPLHNP
jgi:hypothetical protein